MPLERRPHQPVNRHAHRLGPELLGRRDIGAFVDLEPEPTPLPWDADQIEPAQQARLTDPVPAVDIVHPVSVGAGSDGPVVHPQPQMQLSVVDVRRTA
jgi:hypothetical protein